MEDSRNKEGGRLIETLCSLFLITVPILEEVKRGKHKDKG